ncbi:MAG: EamA family transporter [Thermoleophilia bacterium]
MAWGVSDFLGGFVSRRAAAFAVVAASQAVGAVLAVAILAGARPEVPPGRELAFAAAAGGAGIVGLLCFYRALAVGTMSLIAPIASLGALVPLTVDLARGSSPGAVAIAGMFVALAGAALAARAPGEVKLRGAGLAAVAALGFGVFFTLLAEGSAQSAVWAMVAVRTGSAPLALAIALAVSADWSSLRPVAWFVVACGTLDLTANLLFAEASRGDLLSVVSVLGSLYPVVTVALATIMLGERMGRLQAVGAAAALGGVAMIAAG